jgi:hypothetical protein
MQRFSWMPVAATVFALGGTSSVQAQGDWDVVLNGRAVHVGAHKEWNEENWGLGVEREFDSSGRWVKVALANGFKDSREDPSFMAGGSIKRRFRAASHDGWYVDVGVVGFVMTREDVHRNRPFLGALPAVTVGSKRVALNVTYLSGGAVDSVTHDKLRDPDLDGVFFVQLKLDASLFGFGREKLPIVASESQSEQ